MTKGASARFCLPMAMMTSAGSIEAARPQNATRCQRFTFSTGEAASRRSCKGVTVSFQQNAPKPSTFTTVFRVLLQWATHMSCITRFTRESEPTPGQPAGTRRVDQPAPDQSMQARVSPLPASVGACHAMCTPSCAPHSKRGAARTGFSARATSLM